MKLSPIQKLLLEITVEEIQEQQEEMETFLKKESIKEKLFISWLTSPEATSIQERTSI